MSVFIIMLHFSIGTRFRFVFTNFDSYHFLARCLGVFISSNSLYMASRDIRSQWLEELKDQVFNSKRDGRTSAKGDRGVSSNESVFLLSAAKTFLSVGTRESSKMFQPPGGGGIPYKNDGGSSRTC